MGRVIETTIDVDSELFERAREALEKMRHRSVSRDEVVHWFGAELVRMVGVLEMDSKSPGGALAGILGNVAGRLVHEMINDYPSQQPKGVNAHPWKSPPAPGVSPLTPKSYRSVDGMAVQEIPHDNSTDGPPCQCRHCSDHGKD